MVQYTEWRSISDGSIISSIPDSVVLHPNDGDLDSDYWEEAEGGIDGGFSIVSSPTLTHDRSLEYDNDGTSDTDYRIFTGEGEPAGDDNYPIPGTQIEWYHYEESQCPWVAVGFGDDVDNNYRVVICTSSDVSIQKLDAGSTSTLDIIDADPLLSTGTWYGCRFEWHENGDLEFAIHDVDGSGDFESEIFSLSANDTDYEGPGIAFGIDDSGSDVSYVQQVKVMPID